MTEPSDHTLTVLAAWRRELPDVATRHTELAKRLVDLAALVREEIRAAVAAHRLTVAEYDVLAALRRSGAPYRLTPTALARELLLSSGGTTYVVRGLTNRGLVDRTDSTEDARSRQVELTPAGRELAETAVRASAAAQERLLRDVPAALTRDGVRSLRAIGAHVHRR